jgi:hypothetical protein
VLSVSPEQSVAATPPDVAARSPFFAAYPRFYETSETAAIPYRLNLRYEAIFAENRDVFQGASVLDLARHDGRWSLAALKTGASHVVGIEGRPELVANAKANIEHYGIDDGRCRFVAVEGGGRSVVTAPSTRRKMRRIARDFSPPILTR